MNKEQLTALAFDVASNKTSYVPLRNALIEKGYSIRKACGICNTLVSLRGTTKRNQEMNIKNIAGLYF